MLNRLLYFPQIIDCIANVKKIFEFFDMEEEPKQWEFETYNNRKKFIDNDDVILSMQNVSFAYSKDRKVLENFSMKVKKGSFVAIVGESGLCYNKLSYLS